MLDEADRLLDMGFRPAIEAILRHLPPASQRQNLMFSATIPQVCSRASLAAAPAWVWSAPWCVVCVCRRVSRARCDVARVQLPAPHCSWHADATTFVGQGVTEVASLLLRDGYAMVNTVTDDDRPSHESITQVRAVSVTSHTHEHASTL